VWSGWQENLDKGTASDVVLRPDPFTVQGKEETSLMNVLVGFLTLCWLIIVLVGVTNLRSWSDFFIELFMVCTLFALLSYLVRLG
jgi:hypothetical protein